MTRRHWPLALAVGFTLAAAQAAFATTAVISFPNNTLLTFATASNPDTAATVFLTPNLRVQTAFTANAPNNITISNYMLPAGAFTGPGSATLPLSSLKWEGAAVDATGATTFMPSGGTTQAETSLLAAATEISRIGRFRNEVYFIDQRFKLTNSWTRPYGDYIGTIQYSVREAGTETNTQAATLKVTIPPFFAISGTPSTLTLTADPADTDPSAAALAATLKANGNTGETTQMLVSATPLTYGTSTIPYSNFQYRVNSGSWVALAGTGQPATVFTGASAGTSANVDLKVLSSWGYAPTPAGSYYTSTVTYGGQFNASSVQTATLPTTSVVRVSVPARLQLTVDGAAVNLVADPGDNGTENVASRAATVTVKSNYASAKLYVSATTPSSGTDSLPLSGFKYRINTSPAATGGTTYLATLSGLTGNGAWAAFPSSATAIATLTDRTDGAVIGYDYTYDRDWALKSATYTSTVTYTVAGF